jgi:hypothetical protein
MERLVQIHAVAVAGGIRRQESSPCRQVIAIAVVVDVDRAGAVLLDSDVGPHPLEQVNPSLRVGGWRPGGTQCLHLAVGIVLETLDHRAAGVGDGGDAAVGVLLGIQALAQRRAGEAKVAAGGVVIAQDEVIERACAPDVLIFGGEQAAAEVVKLVLQYLPVGRVVGVDDASMSRYFLLLLIKVRVTSDSTRHLQFDHFKLESSIVRRTWVGALYRFLPDYRPIPVPPCLAQT